MSKVCLLNLSFFLHFASWVRSEMRHFIRHWINVSFPLQLRQLSTFYQETKRMETWKNKILNEEWMRKRIWMVKCQTKHEWQSMWDGWDLIPIPCLRWDHYPFICWNLLVSTGHKREFHLNSHYSLNKNCWQSGLVSVTIYGFIKTGTQVFVV